MSMNGGVPGGGRSRAAPGRFSRRQAAAYSHSRFQVNPEFSPAPSSTASSASFRRGLHRKTAVAAQEAPGGSCITCLIPFLTRKPVPRTDDRDNSDATASTKSSVSRIRRGGNHVGGELAAPLSMREIRKATGNFCNANIIGEGGFGTIYRAEFPDGSIVAVKRAKKFERSVSAEIKNEMQTLSQVDHANLVRFLGYLEQDGEQIIVVEYVSNGNLREHLDGIFGEGLNAGERLEIAIDIAHALTYLHTYTDHPIIHRDVKASNILITENLRAKVTDFGFARSVVAEDPAITHITTRARGTQGYLDPEYLKTYQLTHKSDVYSFGVLLVELVTGRRPIDRGRDRERMTTNWAMQKFEAGDVVMTMDPRLQRSPASILAAEKLLGLAQKCLAETRRQRPSMKMCTEILWGVRRDFKKLQQFCSSSSSAPITSQRQSRRDSTTAGGGYHGNQQSGVGIGTAAAMVRELQAVREGAKWSIPSTGQEATNPTTSSVHPLLR